MTFRLNEQHEMARQMVRQWCERTLMPRLPQLESGAELPFELMRTFTRTFGLDQLAAAALHKRITRLRQAGPDGPAASGPGESLSDDPLMSYVVIKELSRVSPGFAMGWGVSLGLAGGAIAAKGTADQIERWGLPIARMDKIASWCLTEPGAGSDALGSMKTTARPADDRGDGGEGYVLNGGKTFITNGPGADLFVVYARLDRGQPAAAQPVVTFVLERGMPGFTQGQPFKKMGMRDSPTCELFFSDVRVPAAHLLGGEERQGGRQDVKESLGSERSAVPAMAWGIIERCYEQAKGYVRERQQFGRPIAEFQAVQLKIADMYIKLKNVENIVYRMAWMQTHKVRDMAFINATKAYCSQVCLDVALTAIQCHGGYGYMEEFHLEKLARDAKLLELGAGTTDINLLSAARQELGIGQGDHQGHQG